MVHRLPYEDSLITRNPFMRWLFACTATNMGLMRNTGVAWQRQRLLTITKRISGNPDELCIESDAAVELLERYLLSYVWSIEIYIHLKYFWNYCLSAASVTCSLVFSSRNSDRLIVIHAAELNHTMYFGMTKIKIHLQLSRNCFSNIYMYLSNTSGKR